MSHFALESRDNGVFVLKIQREKVLNALNHELIVEGIQFIDTLASNPSVKVLVITGSGEKAFVAGADISELNTAQADEGRQIAQLGQQLMNRIEEFPCPVIAAINGFALGGGLELALACDLRYAADSAKLGLPEVTLGLIPGYGGTQRLSRLVGVARASEYIFTGDMVTAQKALEHGLVQGVFPKVSLLDEVLAIAARIAGRAPLAIKAAKRAVRSGVNVDLPSGLAMERQEFAYVCQTEDKAEGTAAFLEKRTAVFKGV